MVFAQDTNTTDTGNTTIPIPDPTNGTIPIPDPANSTDTNSTDPIDGVNATLANPAIVSLLKEQALSRTQEMLLLFGNTTLSSSIANGFEHAMDAMAQAEAFEGTNPQAAANQYLRAMKQYRNALRKHLKDNPEALGIFETSDVNGTAPDDVNGTTTEEIDGAKAQLVERFEERFREQVASMQDNVLNLTSDMSPGDILKAQSALSKAELKLLRIQEKILAGQFDEAVDDLDNTTDTLDDDLGDMTDPGTAQMLKTMNKLEAKISKMADLSERKAAKGQDTSDLDGDLAALRGNKDKTKDDFKKDKGNSSNAGNGNSDMETGKPDKDTGKPDKDTGKPDKDKGKPDKD